MEDYYGDFYRNLFEKIVQQGRCTATQLAQRCHLPLRQVRSGLAGLISLRLVYYAAIPDVPTTYVANLRGIYQILQVGKLVDLVYERHGDLAAQIVATVCDMKFGTVAELCDRVMLHDMVVQRRLSDDDVRTAVLQMVAHGFLIHLRKSQFSTLPDIRREVESEIGHAAMSRVTGVKAKAEHDLQMKDEIMSRVNTTKYEYGFENKGFRSRRADSIVNGRDPAVPKPAGDDDKRLVQPNFYKVVVHAQCVCLQQVVDKTHGKTASAVLGVVLDHVANRDEWSEQTSTLLSSKQIQSTLEQQRKEYSATVTNMNDQGNGHDRSSCHSVSTREIDQHLARLAEGPYTFIEEFGAGWQVDKQQLDKHVAKEELLRLMASRLDHPGPRILRTLIEKGKLEERTLQEMGLLGARELRQSLALMKQMGYLDLQEVPRNPQRQPNQTVFLWFHDYERVQQHILEILYKSMSRLLQLLSLERERISSTMVKIERQDVKNREQQALGEAEYAVLSRFRRIEAWVWAEIGRLDTSVAVLRDVPSLLAGPLGDS